MFDSIFEIIYLIGFVAGSVIRKLYVSGHRQNKIADDWEVGLDMLLLVIVSLGFIAAPLVYLFTGWPAFADYQLPSWAGWIGMVVFAVALVLLWRSHVDLGLNWSPMLKIREEHTLVTKGVYKYIRHPMYSAHFLWAIAQVLLLHNWIAGPAFLVTSVPLYLFRVPLEERMMLNRFGEEYKLYMSRTGRMFPRLWG
ncbi:MAG: protein-S-isoprenylcysteine O-methyltransferase [Planctomycetota bacterium]|jgi:protein-S-isoprenylcysteine O-methyltransferase Ste14